MTQCELCKAEKLTKWFWEDDVCWVVVCRTCRVPMIVYKHHTMTVPLKDLLHMAEVLRALFPGTKIRCSQRRIKDHLHWHVIR